MEYLSIMMRKTRILAVFFLCVCVTPFNSFGFETGRAEAIVPPSGGMPRELFLDTLAEVDDALEEGAVDAVCESVTFDFLHSITNSEYQKVILPYTRQWIDAYGDIFPEVFLLHSLAAGEMSCVSSKYNSLTNLVSRNCARWALMVNNEPLMEDPVLAKQGNYFKLDQVLWPHVPATIFEGRKFAKPVSMSKRGWQKLWNLIVGESIVVVRNDEVPLPWGNSIYPDMRGFPFIAPDKWLIKTFFRLRRDYIPNNRKSFTHEMGMGLSRSTRALGSNEPNRIWNFFARVYSPCEFLGGQVIASKASAPDEISGRFHYLGRLLVKRTAFDLKKNIGDYLNDKSVEQDLVITPPINFSIKKEGAEKSVEFSWEGAILHHDPADYLSTEIPQGFEKCTQIIIRRMVFKGLGLLAILFLGILCLKMMFNKIKKYKGGSEFSKIHRLK